jgi:acetyltransferase-like isoleucine patch superfamily enzyme
MFQRIKRFVGRVRRKLRQKSGEGSEFVDFDAFTDVIAMHRARGVKIGRKVRLLGAIDAVNPHLVSIGDYAVLGVHSALLAHCPIKGAKPVSVGAYSFIAYGALILPGVSVGKCCVVGAGAVVTRSVPDASIVAGNPARILRKLTIDEQTHLMEVMNSGKYFGRDPKRVELPIETSSISADALT